MIGRKCQCPGANPKQMQKKTSGKARARAAARDVRQSLLTRCAAAAHGVPLRREAAHGVKLGARASGASRQRDVGVRRRADCAQQRLQQ
mmetsp:Transcript_42992/g.129066  ORF Transcript_42992/g.129066 Transcript_42992/m.129066 type:complete len:89 (+) Transcript_42992:41-307(+)